LSTRSEIKKIQDRIKKVKNNRDPGIEIHWSTTDPYIVTDPETGEKKEVSREQYIALGNQVVNFLDFFD